MKWAGKQLKYREDWGDALLSLSSPADADAFLKMVKMKRPADFEEIIGYMTDEVDDPVEKARVRALLKVEHPFEKLGFTPTLAESERYWATHDVPQWMFFILKIPRIKMAWANTGDGRVVVQMPLGDRPAPETRQ